MEAEVRKSLLSRRENRPDIGAMLSRDADLGQRVLLDPKRSIAGLMKTGLGLFGDSTVAAEWFPSMLRKVMQRFSRMSGLSS